MQEYRGIGYHINPRTKEIMPTALSAGTKRLWTSYNDLKAFKRDVDEGWENKKHIDLINEKKEISYKIDSLHRQGISSGFDYEKLQELYRQIGGELIHRKHGGKGWRESPGRDGKAPRHQEVAERAQAQHAQNTPMKRNKPSKLVIQNINSDPIQKDTIALSGTTNVTSPQNFQPIKQLTLGNTLYLYYDQPFRVVKEKGSIEILPESSKGHFIMIEDRMGNITLSHSGSKRVAFFQAESDKEFISDLLKKDEKEDMENGYDVKINDSEPRASALSELWEASGGG